jgi:type II secretory pathway component GspD/PulD (secretin)
MTIVRPVAISLAAAVLVLSVPFVSPAQEEEKPATVEEPPVPVLKGEVRRSPTIRLPARRVPRASAEPGAITVEAAEKGKVRVTRGEVPVVEILKALSDLSGLPVFYNSSDPNIPQRQVSFVSDFEAGADLLEQVLAINGFACRRQTSAGKEWIEVASYPPVVPTGTRPVPSRSSHRFVGLEAKPESEKDIDPRQVVTLIAGLRTIPVGEAITAVQGLAFPGRGTSANIPVVQVPTGNLLLVEVPYEHVPYLRGLLLELDRRAEEAGRRLEVVKVRTGKVDVLAAVIERILEGRAAARSS